MTHGLYRGKVHRAGEVPQGLRALVAPVEDSGLMMAHSCWELQFQGLWCSFLASLGIVCMHIHRFRQHTHKYVLKMGWRNASKVKSTGCSSRGPEFKSHTLFALQPQTQALSPWLVQLCAVDGGCFPVTFAIIWKHGHFSTWHKLKSFGDMDPQLRNYLHRIGLWATLWALFQEVPAHCRQCYLWASGCGLSTKTSWTSQSFLVSPLVSVSRALLELLSQDLSMINSACVET